MRSVANGISVLPKDFSQEGGWMVDPGLLGNRIATGMTEPQEVLPKMHVENLVSLVDVLAQAAPDASTEVAPDVSPKTLLGVLTQAAHGVSARAAHDVVVEAAPEISAEGASEVSGDELFNVSDEAIFGDVTIGPLKKVADLSPDSSSIALDGTGALCSSTETCETPKPCSACFFKTVLQSEVYTKTRDIFQEDSVTIPRTLKYLTTLPSNMPLHQPLPVTDTLTHTAQTTVIKTLHQLYYPISSFNLPAQSTSLRRTLIRSEVYRLLARE